MNTEQLPPTLTLGHYAEQVTSWPASGRHIMAQFDEDTIVVYQAYRPSIANYAVQHQRFGGDFSFNRMSWIKPNFLWMMFRSGWAKKEGQERILAIRIRRTFFDEILAGAVESSFGTAGLFSHDEWKSALAESEVRLQWDPDHDPKGACLPRRAVQLGLRGLMLRRFGTEEVVSIEDITPFVVSQRDHCERSVNLLQTPLEQAYLPLHPGAASAVGLDSSVYRVPAPQRGDTPKPGASDAGVHPQVIPHP